MSETDTRSTVYRTLELTEILHPTTQGTMNFLAKNRYSTLVSLIFSLWKTQLERDHMPDLRTNQHVVQLQSASLTTNLSRSMNTNHNVKKSFAPHTLTRRCEAHNSCTPPNVGSEHHHRHHSSKESKCNTVCLPTDQQPFDLWQVHAVNVTRLFLSEAGNTNPMYPFCSEVREDDHSEQLNLLRQRVPIDFGICVKIQVVASAHIVSRESSVGHNCAQL